MTMTRKDYELIAAALDRARAVILLDGYARDDRSHLATQLAAHDTTVREVALALASDSPRFNVDRFLTAAHQGPEAASAQNTINLARDVGPGNAR